MLRQKILIAAAALMTFAAPAAFANSGSAYVNQAGYTPQIVTLESTTSQADIGLQTVKLRGKGFYGHKSFHGKSFHGQKGFHGKSIHGHKSFHGKKHYGYKSFHGKSFHGKRGFHGKTFTKHRGFKKY
ncbi:MAG: hypothetical protein AAF292_06040 [Pseudomonadota bacterium]